MARSGAVVVRSIRFSMLDGRRRSRAGGDHPMVRSWGRVFRPVLFSGTRQILDTHLGHAVQDAFLGPPETRDEDSDGNSSNDVQHPHTWSVVR